MEININKIVKIVKNLAFKQMKTIDNFNNSNILYI